MDISRQEARLLEQALRAAADNIVYILEECQDPDMYIEDDVVVQLREALKIIEELLYDS